MYHNGIRGGREGGLRKSVCAVSCRGGVSALLWGAPTCPTAPARSVFFLPFVTTTVVKGDN